MTVLKAKCETLGAAMVGLFGVLLVGCSATSQPLGAGNQNRDADSLLIVDCLLPGQIRQLGTRLTYQSPRRPIKASASACQIRGGEYVAYDRANFSTALKIWLPRAQDGDPSAQTYVGEIYEKGMGLDSDYKVAAGWYKKAASQNYSRAMINLGYLYETGLGVEKDLTTAMNFYRDASGITDGDIEYVSSVEFANRVAARAETASLKKQVSQLQQDLASSESRYRQEQQSLTEQQQALASLKQEIEQQKSRMVAEPGLASARAQPTISHLKQIDILKNQVAIAQTEEQKLRTELASRQAQTSGLRREYADANRELFEAQSQLDQKTDTIEQLQARIAVAGADQDQQQALLERTQLEVDELEQTVAQLKQNRSASDVDLENTVAEAQAKELALTRQIDNQADVIGRLLADQSEVEARYSESIGKLQSQLMAGRDEQQRLTSKLSAASLETEQQLRDNESLRAELNRQTQAVAEREQEQRRLTGKFAELQLSRRTSASERDSLRVSLTRAESELASARLEQTRLTNRLLSQQLTAQQQEKESAFDLAVLEGKLSEREAAIRLQNERLAVLESDVSRTRAQLNDSPREQIAQVVASGPLIDIINPPVLATRGAPTLPARQDGSLELIGKVDPADKLLVFNINGEAQELNPAGVFKYRADVATPDLELVAIDQNGLDTRLKLRVDSGSSVSAGAATATGASADREPSLKGIEFGKYYALVIGNNRYASLSDLNTAENDATTIDRLLREKYGFHTELLLNATRIELLTALNRLRETLTPKDNLLVYYAGHGELDKVNQRGYWLPVDADATTTDNWVSNSAVTDFLDTMAAKHILVIADSCYSGTMTRSSLARRQPDMTADVRARWLKAISRSKVRAVLSSGGVKPVYDGSINAKHSLFAEVFIDELQNNPSVLEGYSLFYNLQQRVNDAAVRLGVDQNPQYSPIKHAGHEAGEFLFIPAAMRNI